MFAIWRGGPALGPESCRHTVSSVVERSLHAAIHRRQDRVRGLFREKSYRIALDGRIRTLLGMASLVVICLLLRL